MTALAPSFLGKKVYIDGNQSQFYVVKYEEKTSKQSIDVLLFEHEVPVIFGIMDFDGNFLDSFYVTSKTTKASGEALEKYKEINSRKKQHRMTQDDLKDALKPESEAKMKNKKIKKLLRDEHLEDIKHQWPSRLITLQREENGAENSLIMEALFEAVETANPKKSYSFLKDHRIDHMIPAYGRQVSQHPELLEKVSSDYFYANQGTTLQDFLLEAASAVPLTETKLIEDMLVRAEKLGSEHDSEALKKLLTKFSRRVKQESDLSMREWLNEITSERTLKQAVVASLKK
jgi:hypothetical protein